MRTRFSLSLCLMLLLARLLPGQDQPAAPKLNDAQATAVADIDRRADELKAVNHAIWEFAEVGLQEHRSSQLLIDKLRANGFTIQSGVAHMPTAFVASYGSGTPVIGLLAEYDALPDLSQKVSPEREPAVEG